MSMSVQRRQIPVKSYASTLWVHIAVTVVLDIDLLLTDSHAMTLMSVLRIQMVVLRTAQIQREATVVPAVLDTAWLVMDWGAWVRQTDAISLN